MHYFTVMLWKSLRSHCIHPDYGMWNDKSKGKAVKKTLKVVVVMDREYFAILQSVQGSERSCRWVLRKLLKSSSVVSIQFTRAPVPSSQFIQATHLTKQKNRFAEQKIQNRIKLLLNIPSYKCFWFKFIIFQ